MRLMLWMIVVALSVGGCAGTSSSNGAAGGQALQPKDQVVSVPVKPEWQEYVATHYQEAALSTLIAPATARFVGVPRIGRATYNATKLRTRLIAVGIVDSQNVFGALVRTNYMVVFTRSGPPDNEAGQWVARGVSDALSPSTEVELLEE